MKKATIVILLILLNTSAFTQRNPEVGITFTNTISAKPLSSFGDLFKKPFHPGIELSYGFNWATKPNHDWYQQIKLGYFFHRFVQHGIPLYTNFGYRYKFTPHIFTEVSIGGGYLHSIPATAKLKADANGDYKNNKGIGRPQAMAAFNIGAGYKFTTVPLKLYVNYQPRIQFPFVKSYVPMLPYNSLMIGAAVPLNKTQL